jgi:hypothetical protein
MDGPLRCEVESSCNLTAPASEILPGVIPHQMKKILDVVELELARIE